MPPGRPALRFSAQYRVRFDEADEGGALRASAHLRLMQDVAWQHSAAAGFDMAWYASQQRFWLVRFLELTVAAPIPYGRQVEVTTEVVAMHRFWARRLSEFRLSGGMLAATGRIDWVMTDGEGRPARIPEAMAAAFPLPGPSERPARMVLPGPPGDGPASAAVEAVVRRSEVDPMRHMNNAAYLDHLEDAVAGAGGADLLDARPRRYRLQFLLPAQPFDRITGRAWEADAGWCFTLCGEDGAALFRGIVDRPAEETQVDAGANANPGGARQVVVEVPITSR